MNTSSRDVAPLSGAAPGSCLSDADFAELIDDHLAPDARRKAQAHLGACAACRQLVAELLRANRTDGAYPASADPPAPTAILPVGATLGRYVVLSCVGLGGLGIVYEAYDPHLERRVAIKLLRERAASRESDAGHDLLLREAKSLAKLSHPNVVAVHDVGVLAGRVFIAMELVAGPTVRAWLNEEERGWRRVLEVFVEAGRGLLAAHEAGLVHRDFKPDNVLIRPDGRACVTDFGLARSWPRAVGDGSSIAAVLDDAQTVTGELSGTPAYMAPERFAGRRADARSDQFAFGVSLFEALHRVRPFGGATLTELRASIAGGRPRAVAPGHDVPDWVQRAVVRALSTDPDARFASMHDLLDALDEPRRARRGRRVLGALWLLAGAAAVGLALQSARAPKAPAAPVCGGGEEKLRNLWDEPTRLAAQRAFEATGAPYAGVAWSTVDRGVRAFLREWSDAYTDACEATRVRGEQSEQLLDQRMVCLEMRRKEVVALRAGFVRADPKTVEKAAESIGAIRAPGASCAAQALRGRPAWPADPSARTRLEAVESVLAEAKATRDAGHYKEARGQAETAMRLANEAAFDPLRAEAAFYLAEMEDFLGDEEPAAAHAVDAALAAQAANDDEFAAKSWSFAVIVGAKRTDFKSAHLYARLASAVIARSGDKKLEGLLLSKTSALLRNEGAEGAEEAARRGLALIEDADGTNTVDYLRARHNHAVMLTDIGRFDEAISEGCGGAGLMADLLGPEHPRTMNATFICAIALDARGRYDEGLDRLRHVLPRLERSLGPEHETVAAVLAEMGHALTMTGEVDEAQRLVDRALRIYPALGPTAPPEAAVTHRLRGEIALAKGDWNLAEREARGVIAFFEKRGMKSDVAFTLDLVGRTAFARGHIDAAVANERRAVELFDANEKEHPFFSACLASLGEMLVRQGRLVEARQVLERATVLFDAHPGEPRRLDRARALLAEQRGGSTP